MSALDGDGRMRLQDAIEAAVAVAPLLEDHNFYIDQRFYTAPRRLVLEIGRRLGLVNSNDVFYLSPEDAVAGLSGTADGFQQRIEVTKQELQHWRGVTPPPYVGSAPSAGAPVEQPARMPEREGELTGMGVSAGVARGPARVLHSLAEADRLRPGDILITQVTQPAWTPLFGLARAVVTEVGGMLSHTAVASREFGIPAVAAVVGARRALRDGQLVEVDGSAGVVRVLG
jgi:pyruvate,water dikinase